MLQLDGSIVIRMRHHVIGIFLGALMLATGAQTAAAQREPADCAERSARVMRASPDRNRAELLPQCPESGPATLAALWLHRPPTTHYALRELRYVSVTFVDVRILDAVERVVDAPDRSTQERVAALNVLLYYYDHTLAPVDTEFVDPNTLTRGNVTDTARPKDGAQPLPPDVRSRIANRLARISSADPDTTFRRVAHRVRQMLAFLDPLNAPVSAGAITLIAGCGDRVTLRSTADIDLPVEVRALDSTRAYSGGIRRGTTTNPSEILLGLPPGVIVATLGGREIARLTQRDAPCAEGQIRGGRGM
jgi:hypothetical protein